MKIELDGIDDLMRKLNSLTTKDAVKSYEKALKKGASLITSVAKRNLKSSVRNLGVSRASIKYGRLDKGIKVGKVKYDADGVFVAAHIMGDYRLKWLEKGTNIRQTKKGFNRGNISGKYFFSSAVSQTQNQVQEVITSELDKEINKRYYRI